jgi:hypothetical protein
MCQAGLGLLGEGGKLEEKSVDGVLVDRRRGKKDSEKVRLDRDSC